MGSTGIDDSSRPFKMVGLDAAVSATGLKDETILVSWYITLLRTREGSQISFEWANETEQMNRLAVEDLVGLQSSVNEAAVAVSKHLGTGSSNTLLLSTGSLSRDENEVSWPFVRVR